MPLPEPDNFAILRTARDNALRLWELLLQQQAELESHAAYDPMRMGAGLSAVRNVAEAARQLFLEAEQALHARGGDLANGHDVEMK